MRSSGQESVRGGIAGPVALAAGEINDDQELVRLATIRLQNHQVRPRGHVNESLR